MANDIFENDVNFVSLFKTISKHYKNIRSAEDLGSNQISVLKKSFSVESNETILGYVESRTGILGFSTDITVVFSDCAIYGEKGKKASEGGKAPRISYDEICSYILLAYSNSVKLVNENKTIVLVPSNLIQTFYSISDDVHAFLQEYQKVLFNSKNIYRKQRIDLCEWLERKADNEIKKGSLSVDTSQELHELSKEKAFTTRIYYYLVKNAVLNYDGNELHSVFKELDKLEDVNVSDVQSMAIKLMNATIAYYSDFTRTCNIEEISKEYSNLKANQFLQLIADSPSGNRVFDYYDHSYLPELEKLFYLRFSCIDSIKFLEGISKYTKSVEDKKIALNIKAADTDSFMLSLFSQIRSGSGISEKGVHYHDSLGFNVLHYAILTKSKNSVDLVLKYFSELPKYPDYGSGSEIDTVFDYCFIAYYIGMPEVSDLVYDCSPEMVDLINARKTTEIKIKAIRALLFGLNSSISFGNSTVRKVKKAERRGEEIDYDSFEEYQEKLENLESKREEYEDILRGLEEDLPDMISSIEEIRKIHQQDLKDRVDEISQSGNILVQAILSIYDNYPDRLASYLSSKFNERTPGVFGDFIFSIPNRIINDIPSWNNWEAKYAFKFDYKEKNSEEAKRNTTSSKKVEDTTSYKKPYGNHWFSDEAYSNARILQKEYRVLVKLYHPDENPDGVKCFIDIQSERASILERLEV